MSVIVDHLTRIYGNQLAINDISFEAHKGKVTGFLGPNGAGKSTTMKISTGFIRATTGDVRVDGISVGSNPFKCKQTIGYLPENNPLYLEMYIKEFLGFVGHSYGLKSRLLKNKIAQLVDQCGLGKEENKKIGNLSKGYRQRVGLAKTLMGDPSVLILDEPTSGLDPNQLIEIRTLIKELSEDKTVILSSHIMQEVEAICDHVVIIDQGNIVADASLDELKNAGDSAYTFSLWFENEVDISLFKHDSFKSVKQKEAKVLIIESNDLNARRTMMKIISDHDLPLINLKSEERSLEQVFHQITSK